MATSDDAIACVKLYNAPVFPVVAQRKEPPVLPEFYLHATMDADVIRSMWRDPMGGEHNHNIGVLCDNHVFFDLDPKRNPNVVDEFLARVGCRNLDDLGTLIVSTAGMGWHIGYALPPNYPRHLSGLKVKLAGVDIRSYHNYVLGDGSEISAENSSNGQFGWYAVRLGNAHPPIECPPHLLDLCRETLVYKVKPGQLNDSPTSIAAYVDFLAARDGAIEGSGGEQHTFGTALKGRDLGLTEETTFDLISLYFNNKCVPEWEEGELAKKVRNAYTYAKGEAGREDVTRQFAAVSVIPPSTTRLIDTGMADPVNRLPERFTDTEFTAMSNLDDLQPPEFVLYPLLVRGAVTGISGLGGTGKSALTIAASLHLATATPFLGDQLSECRVAVYATEDRLEDQRIRWRIATEFYGVDIRKVAQNVYLIPQLPRIKLVKQGRNGAERDEEAIAYLTNGLRKIPNLGLFVIDPFRTIHSAKENDNDSMSMLIEDVLCTLAIELNIAILFAHHPSKDNSNDTNSFRGASTIRETPRLVFELNRMQITDKVLIKLTPVKANMLNLDTLEPMIFERTGHKIVVRGVELQAPVIVPYQSEAVKDANEQLFMQAVANAFVLNNAIKNKGVVSFHKVIDALQKAGVLKHYQGRTYGVARPEHIAMLQDKFATAIAFKHTNGHVYHFIDDGKGNLIDTFPGLRLVTPATVAPIGE